MVVPRGWGAERAYACARTAHAVFSFQSPLPWNTWVGLARAQAESNETHLQRPVAGVLENDVGAPGPS